MKTTKVLFGILIITAALAMQVHAQTILTNGLAAYYPFNGNANDESGNGWNGTVYGATLDLDRSGQPSNAYHFNGNSRIFIGNTEIVSGLALTLAAWIKPDSVASTNAIVSSGNWNSYALYTTTDSVLGEM